MSERQRDGNTEKSVLNPVLYFEKRDTQSNFIVSA